MKRLLILHGPNLNLLGKREPHIYGSLSLREIDEKLKHQAEAQGIELESFQSNAEHALLDKIQQTKEQSIGFIVINPAAFGHTSIALRDALLAVSIPFIEVHLSNTLAREPFRHTSYLSDIAHGLIMGLGPQSYFLAVEAACQHLKTC